MKGGIEARATPWREVVMACRKCARKLGQEGFGPDGRDTLAQALKAELRGQGRRRDVRVVETRCLGLCPKRAIAVLLASNPGEILAVAAGTPAGEVVGRMRPPPPP